MSNTTEYFSMQGRVAIGVRNADGSRAPARWVYDASTLEWDFQVDRDEKIESYSGARGLAGTMAKKKAMTVKLTLGQINDSNAALSIAGKTVQVTGGTATDENIGDVKPGDMVALDNVLVTSLVLSGTAPATPVLDTDYTVNTDTGVVTFLTACTGVKASYTYGAYSIVTALTAKPQDLYVLFDGMNTVDGATLLARGEVHRIQFDPTNTLSLINDTFADMQLTGAARIDPVRISDAKYGGYARLMLIDPPAVP